MTELRRFRKKLEEIEVGDRKLAELEECSRATKQRRRKELDVVKSRHRNVLELDPSIVVPFSGPVQLHKPHLVGKTLIHLNIWYKSCVNTRACRN